MSAPINRDLVKYVLKLENELIRSGKKPKPEPFKDDSESEIVRNMRIAMFPKLKGDVSSMSVGELLTRWKSEARAAVSFTRKNRSEAKSSPHWPASNVVAKSGGFEFVTLFNKISDKVRFSTLYPDISDSDDSKALYISFEDEKIQEKLEEEAAMLKLQEYAAKGSQLLDVIMDIIWPAIKESRTNFVWS